MRVADKLGQSSTKYLLSKNNFAECYFYHNFCESLLFILFKSINAYVFNCINVNFCTVRHLTDPPWPRASGTGEWGGNCGAIHRKLLVKQIISP